MEKNRIDKRVREQHFCLRIMLAIFLVLAAWTTVQMVIIGNYIDHAQISRGHVVTIVVYWLIAAAEFTLLTTHQINRRYEKSMRQFAQATKKYKRRFFCLCKAAAYRK